MDSQHKVGTNPWNEAAVPVVWSGTHHQRIGQGTGRRAPETRQAAHGGACGSPGGVQRNGRAGMDDGRAALMCSCLKESRVRARQALPGRKEPSPAEIGWSSVPA